MPFQCVLYHGPVRPVVLSEVLEDWRDSSGRNEVFSAMARAAPQAAVLTHDDVCSTSRWRSSPFHRKVLEPNGIDQKLYAISPATAESRLVTWVSRGPDQPAFSPLDRAVIGLLQDQLMPWLASAIEQHHARARQHLIVPQILEATSTLRLHILVGLLEGLTEAQIGARVLRRSSTVHDHVKRLYRDLRVTSRVQLGLELAPHIGLLHTLIAARPPLASISQRR